MSVFACTILLNTSVLSDVNLPSCSIVFNISTSVAVARPTSSDRLHVSINIGPKKKLYNIIKIFIF